jgi:hypothetical protein
MSSPYPELDAALAVAPWQAVYDDGQLNSFVHGTGTSAWWTPPRIRGASPGTVTVAKGPTRLYFEPSPALLAAIMAPRTAAEALRRQTEGERREREARASAAALRALSVEIAGAFR